MYINFKAILFVLLCCFVCSDASVGSTIDGGDQKLAYDSMNLLINEVQILVAKIMINPQLVNAANMFFSVFAITLIVMTMFHYSHGSASYEDLIVAVLIIGITKVLMGSYDLLTSGVWGWFVGLANGIQQVATGTTQPAQIPLWLGKVASSITVVNTSTSSWIPSLPNFTHIFAALAVYLLALVLSVMSFFASAWAVWGYAIAKIIGWFFIPFLMFEKLSFIFDGWLRFFLGFPIYALIARINILLMAITVKLYFGLVTTTYSAASFNQPIEVVADNVSDIFGLAGIMFIGIMALLSTGTFAASIIGGTSGFSGGLRGVMTAMRTFK